MVDDLSAFVRDLAPVILVGHSMGGFNSYAFAAQHPQMVERLVIVDTGPEFTPAFVKRVQHAVQERDVFDDPDELFQRQRRENPRPSDAEWRHYVMHSIRQRSDGKWILRFDVAFRVPGVFARIKMDAEAQWALLPKITCPTLLMCGAKTDHITPETM